MSGKGLIAVVDDEKDIRDLVALHLEKSGFAVQAFAGGKEFLCYLQNHTPQAVILDLLLPDMDGLEICKRLRQEEKWARIPVLMLTAKAEEVDVIVGLEIGADDYMTKPFSNKEMVARVRALLRRSGEKEMAVKTIILGGILVIDADRHAVWLERKKVELTVTEFAILSLLSRRTGWVFSREKILEALWGNDKDAVTDRTIDVHIRHLRVKLGRAGTWLKNVRGIGYKIET